nr:ranBP2-like and GRIP domain-containing protein 4 isoform X1 [Onthophagus taurus]
MFSTKLEVDKHVENCLKKINSENERNLRCIAFAKLYFKVADYEQARRYVSIYLGSKPLSAEAHQLLGKILEKQGKFDAAFEAYRSSLEIDSKQNNVIMKVCELLANENVNFDVSSARFFCERAQSIDPNNPLICTLKEKLIMLEGKDPDDVSRLLKKELEARPTDIDIQVRLLRHFLQNNQIKEAYKHAYEIEHANLSVFIKSFKWYKTIAEVLVKYQQDNYSNKNLNWEFWMLLVSVLDKLVYLNLDETNNSKTPNEYVGTVFNFDQTLKIAVDNIRNCPEKQLLQEFLNHYRGQLCFHLITLMYKQAKNGLIKYKEAYRMCLPLLFAAYHTQPVDLQCLWINHTSESNKQLVKRWNLEASYRCSQIGHMLTSLAKDRKSSFIEKANQSSSGMWREQFFKQLFVTRDQQSKLKTSYFATCPQLVDLTLRLPDKSDIEKFDQVAQLVNPDSLHHYIWLGLNQDLSNFKLSVFDGLQYSIKNLNNCSAESLTILDIQSFLFASILCAQQQINEHKHNNIYYSSDKPTVLPAVITQQFGTVNQTKWLVSAYKMFKCDYGANFSEVRLTLIKGIETIRCVGNHGLDVKLLVLLAKTFAEKAKVLEKQSEIEFNEARAEVYWKTALPLLEKLKNNQAIFYSPGRLFEYKSKEMASSEIISYIDDGRLFIAIQHMKKKDYEKALQLFQVLRDPYASYYLAQIYKTKSEEQTSKNKENLTSEMRSQNIILLSKAKDCLYLTFDRLRDPTVNQKHPLNAILGTEIDKIERMLSRIDPDTYNRNECDGMSDENLSSVGSVDHNNYTMWNNSFLNGSMNATKNDIHQMSTTPLRLDTTTRREARPSPERLDAQLKQLLATRDTSLNHIMDQNKFMVESQKSLVDAVNTFTTNTVEEMRILRTSIDDLKHSICDIQSLSDQMAKMRKDIAELKKSTTTKPKNTELSEEDLYALYEECNTELNNANIVPSLNQNFYPNMGKIAGNPLQYGAVAAATAALYPGMYHPMLPYQGVPLPQPGALTYGPDAQLADYRNLQSSYSQPSPLAQGLNHVGLPLPGMHHTTLSQPGLQNTLQQPNLPATLQQHPPQLQHVGLPHASLSQPVLPQTIMPPQHSVQNNLPQPLLQPSTSSLSQITTSLIGSGFSSSNTTLTGSAYSLGTNPATSLTVSSKAPPVNVVITSSDPLPSTNTNPQPVLSVTIPPQHLKGGVQKSQQPHNYQIQLPPVTTIVTPSVMSQTAPVVVTQAILSNVAPPVYSAVDKTPQKNTSLGFAIEKSLNESFGAGGELENHDLNKSCVSSNSVEEYDPCPDFKAIIPLPDEVPLSTGEEDETVLFDERAKLYRFDQGTKEWKERGVGILKLLKNKSGKVRILMRRDQVHKICANHFINKEMVISPMKNTDKAYFWAANDFADQEIVFEKFCVRFKTADEAHKFYTVFESAKELIPDNTPIKKSDEKGDSKSCEISSTPKTETPKQSTISSLGGFKFTSTPTFLPKDIPSPKEVVKSEPIKSSPFTSFSFTKLAISSPNININNSFTTTQSDTIKSVPEKKEDTTEKSDSLVEEYEPDVVFTPVIPLPELIDVKTGEENAEVLFDCKSRLFRFDAETKQWKERGIGQMKILKFDNVIRFVMRREQVHKVCCNHQLLKSMSFSLMPQTTKIISWCAQDYSEGVLQSELFSLRFKTEEQAQEFLQVIKQATEMLDDNNCVANSVETVEKKSDKKVKPDNEPKKDTPTKQNLSWSEKHKPKHGSWECKVCYVINDGKKNLCAACDTPKNETKKTEANPSQFSFGVKPEEIKFGSPFQAPKTPSQQQSSGWGNAFKPAADSWECQTCLIRNNKDELYCVSCETPKDNTVPKKETNKGVNLDTPGMKFSFGIPQSTTDSTVSSTTSLTTTPKNVANIQPLIPQQKISWGNAFKPPADSWECSSCLVRNAKTDLYCVSCQNPKDDTVPKKDNTTNKGINLETPGLSFSFGIPTTSTTGASFSFGSLATTKPGFSFGTNTTTDSQKPVEFSFTLKPEVKEDDKSSTTEEFVFGSPTKHNFDFTPRSPRRQSSGPGDDDSEDYLEEEEDNIYFKPVIPLPDKVEVKTGEEDEEVLYCHRAKLFRFTNREWKERGIGDVKILRDSKTGKLRVVMRREQVLKICLNHILTAEIKYSAKDEKSWSFAAADYSEGEIEHRQFCLRFKNGDIAKEFMTAIQEAVEVKKIDKPEKSSENNTKSDESDVEIVFETTVTPEEEQEAIKLGLPRKFMAYRQMPDCTCDECKKDDVSLKDILKSKDEQNLDKTQSTNTFGSNTSFFGTPLSDMSRTDSIFQTPVSDALLATPTSTPQAAEQIKRNPFNTAKSETTLKSLLIKPAILNVSKSASEINSSTSSTTVASPKPSFNFSYKPDTSLSTSSSCFSNLNPLTTTHVFGSNKIFSSTTQPSSQIFGGGSIFANPPAKTSEHVFGNTSSISGGLFSNVFGGNSNSTASTPPTSTIFQSSTPNIFGSNFNSSGTPTSVTTTTFQSSSTNIFGGSGSSNVNPPTDKKIETSNTENISTIFGKSALGANTQANLSFGSIVAQEAPVSKEEKKYDGGLPFKTDPNFTFTVLAKSAENAFVQKPSEDENPFTYLGAGKPVFQSATNPNKPSQPSNQQHHKTEDGDHEGGGDGDDEEYDPHFEPIVPLPETIVISTGEEDEEVLFNERAKLYRYDNNTKNWKERGVGQMKILHHPINCTYRLLLRREQVHKVVLNQLITTDLDPQPMSTSDVAWCWFGYNFTDDGKNLENLAVKFKTCKLSQTFREVVQKAIDSVKENQVNKNIPTTVTGFVEDSGGYEEEQHTESNDEDDYDEDEERSIMFRNKCDLSEQDSSGKWIPLGSGDITVSYDHEIFGARIHFTQDDVELSNTMIGMNTVMTINDTNCSWRAVEWANQIFEWRTLQASFSNENDAETFHLSFMEGLEYAQQSDIVDNVPPLHIEGD